MTITEVISSIGDDIHNFFNIVTMFIYGLKKLPDLITQFLGVALGSNEKFFAWLFAKIVELLTLAYFTIMVYLVPFVWDIAKVIVGDIYSAANLQEYAAMLPPAMDAILSQLGVYRALDMLITAYISRWIFKFIPIVGG